MNVEKKIDLLKERNIELSNQVEDLRKKLDKKNEIPNHSDIEELEDLKERWEESISNLKKYEEEYESLIARVKELLKEIKYSEFRIPWYKRMILKIYKIKYIFD